MDLSPCLLRLRCPFAVTVDVGIFFLTISVVTPGSVMYPLLMAVMKVGSVGAPWINVCI